jgi:hypothetical protein
MKDDKIELKFEVDLKALLESIAKSGDLGNDPEVFNALAEVERVKASFKAAQKKLDEIEKQAKEVINGRAKALYGDNWSVIKDSEDRYKILRTPTGSVFEATDDADDEFLKLQISVDTDKVETFIKENSKLPEGIQYNPNRGQSIRINVKLDEEDS